MAPLGFSDKVSFVWKVADKLRGHFKQHEYGSVMLPLLALRRLDAVLADTKPDVIAKAKTFGDIGAGQDAMLKKIAGQPFYNTSPLTMTTMLSDDKNVADQLRAYIWGLSHSAYEVIEAYNFDDKITRMDKAGILYAVLGDFADLDLRPSQVSNEAMGYIFEELLRKFSEMSNETAGEHYTPREVIRLMVDLLLLGDVADAIEAAAKPVRTVYDPAAGTGGMLTGAIHRMTDLNPAAHVEVYGQELNDETWAIARSDLMLQNIPPERMSRGNSLTQDAYPRNKFDFVLANPPYGVDWKTYAAPIKEESEKQGFDGRFGAGTPRISDGSLLFLQHMISKMKPSGSRIAIVLSGSPLFSGAAGSGESEIRRWIIENDLLEGIVALPDQMFYNTGISTYVWILTNDKWDADRGQITLVDARKSGSKLKKSLGDKRKELTFDAIDEVIRLYGSANDPELSDDRVKVLPNEAFGFQRITVERPLRRCWVFNAEVHEMVGQPVEEIGGFATFATEKEFLTFLDGQADLSPADRKKAVKAAATHDPDADPILKKGKPEPDADLRDQENVPLPPGFIDLDEAAQEKALIKSAEEYLEREIRPYVEDAWIDHSKTKIGYEIPFTRQFYVYEAPRPVDEIAAEIRALEEQIQGWMRGLNL
jgi:type I restriction enzyme M protein